MPHGATQPNDGEPEVKLVLECVTGILSMFGGALLWCHCWCVNRGTSTQHTRLLNIIGWIGLFDASLGGSYVWSASRAMDYGDAVPHEWSVASCYLTTILWALGSTGSAVYTVVFARNLGQTLEADRAEDTALCCAAPRFACGFAWAAPLGVALIQVGRFAGEYTCSTPSEGHAQWPAWTDGLYATFRARRLIRTPSLLARPRSHTSTSGYAAN
jgi:hypothetical protein